MKKGFTLIELLAVIVILAIVALITSPIIIGIMDDARKGAFTDSAYGIIKAGEIFFSTNILNGTFKEVTFNYKDGVESPSITGKKLDYKGEKPKSGSIIINSEGQIALAIHDGTYCVNKKYKDIEVTISLTKLDECTIFYNDGTGAPIPELATGMIPVTYDETNSRWIKADIYEKWYDYNSQMWANAVTVTGTNRETYLNAKPGIEIPIADINTMWVWIPRYKYAIPTGTGAREINIVFESKSTTKSTGNADGTNYRTHPAFWWNNNSDDNRDGDEEISGFWVGKFETTTTLQSPTILPRKTPIEFTSLSGLYKASRKMEKKLANEKVYGWETVASESQLNTNGSFNDDTNDIDIHMAKNSEWGAVAYLSRSKYGKNSEVYKNNNNATSDTTGCAGDYANDIAINRCEYSYNTVKGGYASTTGNIYGVYDMSGGTEEFVMGLYLPISGSIADGSGFSANASIDNLPASKYWDRYTTSDLINTACNGKCYGHALSETSGWYGASSPAGSASYPWFTRGSDTEDNSGADIFTYSRDAGNSSYSFRVVLLKP